MKRFIAVCLTAVAAIYATPAYADDDVISTELKANADVSNFYQAMVSTGVINELDASGDYMLFAPINSAFDKLVPDVNKCVMSVQCKATLSKLLRNHIVDDDLYFRDIINYRSGFHSINKHFIPLQQVSSYRFNIEGNNILENESTDNGTFYVVDGVLATDYERSLITAYQQAAEPEIKKTTTTERTTIPDPACGPEGCPDTKTTTTIIKKTVTEVEP